jgi:hypothetical protein
MLANEICKSINDASYVLILKFLIICSLYLRGSISEGKKTIIDFLEHYRSLPPPTISTLALVLTVGVLTTVSSCTSSPGLYLLRMFEKRRVLYSLLL